MSTRDVNEILKQYKREEKETRERVVIEKEEKEKEIIFIKEIRSIAII